MSLLYAGIAFPKPASKNNNFQRKSLPYCRRWYENLVQVLASLARVLFLYLVVVLRKKIHTTEEIRVESRHTPVLLSLYSLRQRERKRRWIGLAVAF